MMTEQKLSSRTFTTKVPDKPGAFMLACKIIMNHKGNIIRVSYNKVVDIYTLFVEVRADVQSLDAIAKELSEISYLDYGTSDEKVVVVNVKIKDVAGALYPVLEIFDKYSVNLSYLNSNTDNSEYQNFKMGLIIENPELVKHLLDDISELYQIDIVDYSDSDPVLDNTIYYIRLANSIQKLFSLSMETTMEFIRKSRKISHLLQTRGEDPHKVFDNINKLASFISFNKDDKFNPEISEYRVTNKTTLHVIEPPCGSNTYVLESDGELLFIDTGMGIFANEMTDIFREMFPSFFSMKKKILITHADTDHCGLLSVLDDADIILNRKSADILNTKMKHVMDGTDKNAFCVGYNALSGIITDYVPPKIDRFTIIGKNVPAEHDDVILIDTVKFSDIELEIYEGSGGHLNGEMIFLSRNPKMIFTGDVYLNTKNLTKQRAEFDAIAPYLLTDLNMNPEKEKKTLASVNTLMSKIGKTDLLVCSGHGSVEKL